MVSIVKVTESVCAVPDDGLGPGRSVPIRCNERLRAPALSICAGPSVEATVLGAIMIELRASIDMDRTPARQRKIRGQIAPGIRSHWPWALVLGTAVFATTFAPIWGFVVLGIGLVLAGVKAAITERLQEVFRRKPDLTLLASVGEGHGTVVEAPTLRPWPIDVERIVAHELKAARESERRDESILTRLGTGDPFAIRPSQAEKDRALAAFREDVEQFAAELREWLATYLTAADERLRTFELYFEIASGARGAHAEGVTLALELPPGIEAVDEWPTVSPPPETPVYTPPRPRSMSELTEMRMVAPMSAILRSASHPVLFEGLTAARWSFSKDKRRVEAELGDLHHGRTRELQDTVLLRAAEPGSYELRWTMYAKNSRRHCTGTITLVARPTPPRPAFGTMDAIRRYPDVPFVDDLGEVAAARADDPPTEPPPAPTGDGLAGRLQAMAASREWRMLGFDDSFPSRE